MRQEKNKNLKGSEKFEEGVLRSEDLPQNSFGLSAVWEERRLMNNVYKLISKGFKVKPAQSLEAFIEEHKDALEEGA